MCHTSLMLIKLKEWAGHFSPYTLFFHMVLVTIKLLQCFVPWTNTLTSMASYRSWFNVLSSLPHLPQTFPSLRNRPFFFFFWFRIRPYPRVIDLTCAAPSFVFTGYQFAKTVSSQVHFIVQWSTTGNDPTAQDVTMSDACRLKMNGIYTEKFPLSYSTVLLLDI